MNRRHLAVAPAMMGLSPIFADGRGTSEDDIVRLLDDRRREIMARFDADAADREKIREQIAAMETRALDLEQRFAARTLGGGRTLAPSLGAQVAESERFKAFVAAGGTGKCKIELPNASITSVDFPVPSDRRGPVDVLPRRPLRIRDLLPAVKTSSNLIEYAQQTARTIGAAPTAESGEKPESTFEVDLVETRVRTIAHWFRASRQVLDDSAQLGALIDADLRYGLALVEEEQLLKGSGIGENLSGLVTEATAYTPAFVPDNPQMIDTIGLAILQVEQSYIPAEFIVMHPTDWRRITLLKDAEERYLGPSPFAGGPNTMWGVPVVTSFTMDPDEFLVGNGSVATLIHDRMGAEIMMSDEDRDNFITNMVTIRGEQRLALAIKRPLALVTGDFGNLS